ncbi:MAG: flagellar filament capping protein FliD [Oscillospiraceae bacterium]|jgi:flagellar hook-associated protein 2|nr:flagellar filament capping protein FliD [Oscillospiraceae bacterium]
MASSLSGINTTMRLTGMASGLDTDSIIKTLSQIEQLKLDKVYQKQTTLSWKQEALTGVRTVLNDFRNNFGSVLGADSMLSSSAFNTNKATVTGGQSNAVTVEAQAEANLGSYTIDEITQLAKSATASTSGGFASTGLNVNAAVKDSLSGLAADENGNFSFKINGQEFTFNKDDSLSKVMKAVNSNTAAGVTMSYSQISNKITISSKTTGAESKLTLENGEGGNFFSAGAASGIAAGEYAGQNAKMKINGYDVERSSNTFTLDGLKFTLNKTTTAGSEPIDVTVSKDVDAAVEKIKKFVTGYNTMINKLNTLVTEKKSSTQSAYTALTEAEKAEMTSEQIADWEKIAKIGILNNDDGIESVLTALRQTLYQTAGGTKYSPSSIGIGSSSYFDYTPGQISLDETKLRAALESDPDGVAAMFTESKSSGASSDGFITKINNVLSKYVTDRQKNQIDDLDEDIEDTKEKFDTMTEKMNAKIEKYYQQFAAMETLIAEMNNQSSAITALFSSLTGAM